MRRSIWASLSAAFAVALGTAGCTQLGVRNDQNWTARDQYHWYRASQGSRLIPFSWLTALQDADGSGPFMRQETIEKYHYLAAAPDDASQLPIGFALDDNRHNAPLAKTDLRWFKGQGAHERWVGMNCAACHTAQLEVDGKPVRVDGGPTMADFQGFTSALYTALQATADDPDRWARFCAAVLGKRNDPGNRALLKAAFDNHVKMLQDAADLNKPSTVYGPGRLDAIGHIFNKVAYLARPQGQFHTAADAPVSYPFLWNVPQHKVVQWNGIAPNTPIKLAGRTVLDAGALVRNAGEVIGVFADVGVQHQETIAQKLKGFPSSLDVTNLVAMERQLERLKPPSWPTGYDAALAAKGKQLFADHCASCHFPLPRDDLTSPANEHMIPVWGQGGAGTDPWMACNAYSYKARTGPLTGMDRNYLPLGNGGTFDPVDYTRSMLVATAVGSLAGKKRQIIEAAATSLFNPQQPPALLAAVPNAQQEDKLTRLEECKHPPFNPQLLAYKARPLGGIWATGPYLHNGSVRTLYELLLDPAKRSRSFNVGSRKLDTHNVGYADEPAPNGWVFRASALSANDGNYNGGHDYNNAALSDPDRWALVEYMKSL